MSKAVWTAAAALAVFTIAVPAIAQSTATATVNVTVNVSARATLDLHGTNSVTFADADPDTTPSIAAPALTIDVKSRTSAASNVTLTVVSNQDLTSGSDVIGIANLTWTSTGTGFAAGTMNKTTAQTVGSWTGSGTRSGTVTLKLANSWAYNAGAYTATLTYTLTAP
ncbi:MAG TPA: hypothetical protein VL484_03845 [Vicinamibacterales bacterium]|jgi:hypothetical protein|nr:hypothetical protein [Vicinamibacterales bacterium]